MIGPEVTVPDLAEAVIGYRVFAIRPASQHNYKLASPHQGATWDKPEQTAQCTREIKIPEGILVPRPPKPHTAPAKDCGCGIYAYFDPCPVRERPYDPYRFDPHPRDTEIEALMTLEGRIEVHERGMRAQRAKICALGLNPTVRGDHLAAVREIAKCWDIPLVDQADLPRLAPEYGRELGKELRPATAPTTPASEPPVWVEPPASRSPRSRLRWVPPVLNGSVAVVNLGLFVAHGGPLSISCAAFSASVMAYGIRLARRT